MKANLKSLANKLGTIAGEDFRKNKGLKIIIVCVFAFGILTLCWYHANHVIPPVQAGEGEAINPELKKLEDKGLGGLSGLEGRTAREEVTTPEETRQDRYAKHILAKAAQEGLQRIPRAPRVEAKTYFSYSPTGLYEIYCREGYLTDIQLQPGEDIQYIGGGDTVRWIVDRATSGSGEAKRWHIYVKPLRDGITTNFMITTDRRAYQVRAKATADFYNAIIGWSYPIDEKAAFVRQKEEQMKKEEEEISQGGTPEKMNFQYRIEEKTGFWGSGGNYSWTPKMVFDDGAKTYIQMSPGMSTGEAPALFVTDDSGNLALVNYRVKKNYYIVDRLFSKAELRNGTKEIVYITRNK